MGERHMLFITMDLLDDSLERKLPEATTAYTHVERRTLGHGIAQGIAYLHGDLRLMHRDLRPGNIMMKGRTPRIIDFGMSESVPPEGGVIPVGPGIGGSPRYCPTSASGEIQEPMITPSI